MKEIIFFPFQKNNTKCQDIKVNKFKSFIFTLVATATYIKREDYGNH